MYQKPDRPEKNYRHLKSHSLDQVIYSRHVRTVQHMQINERDISHKKKTQEIQEIILSFNRICLSFRD